MVEKQQVVKIKVPRGLPDPTPHIPAANPPTVEKWRLGKTLFYQPIVKTDKRVYSCATCHDPRHGFSEDPSNPARAKYHTPSLVNVVFNRRQFWDGRVETLEETLFRGPDDERKQSAQKRLERGLEQHVWGGWVRELAQTKNKDLEPLFVQAFGTDRPTQTNVAQALATYMRTILSGDSLYDQAGKALEVNDIAKSAASFEPLLKDEATAQSLRDNASTDQPKREELAKLWATGNQLFHGRARCAQCHRGALFTDGDFHNIGCDDKESWPEHGHESGRAVYLVGALKEMRLIGAFRTPSLRNLKDRSAYFHDGSRGKLVDVIEFYDHEVPPRNPYIAKTLRDGEHSVSLHLTVREAIGLVVFLLSLQGQPVDAVISAP
jgi:cytochrome c peroxidase